MDFLLFAAAPVETEGGPVHFTNQLLRPCCFFEQPTCYLLTWFCHQMEEDRTADLREAEGLRMTLVDMNIAAVLVWTWSGPRMLVGCGRRTARNEQNSSLKG